MNVNFTHPTNAGVLRHLERRGRGGRAPASCSPEALANPYFNLGTHPDLVQLPEEGLDLEAYLESIRTQLMIEALERTSGVQTQAAELLGMSFRSFRYYAMKAGIKGGD